MSLPLRALPRVGAVPGRVKATALAAAMGLPEAVQRRLAGPPVVVDGLRLAVDTQTMLRMQRLAGEPPVESLPIPQGRVALRRQSLLVGGTQRIGSVEEMAVGKRRGRLYSPTSPAASNALLVFVHGGGYIYGDLEMYDPACRFLAERSGIRVLSVDYRLAPEHPFPAPLDDAVGAYRWVVDHADELGVDPDRIAVGGDSAGGNMAAHIALTAARDGLPCAYQLLIYPTTDLDHATDSYALFGSGFFLTKEFIELAGTSYVGEGTDGDDPRIDLLGANEVPAGLAPAYVVTAGFDPLRDEGEAYAEKLAAAGVDVRVRRFEDQIHGFLNVVGVGRSSRRANAEIAAELRRALT